MSETSKPTSPFRAMQERLDSVSQSFCLAKWLQVTLHLDRGFTHSCHHPKTHHIPLKELADTPAALHNTKKKISIRQEMLSGVQSPECHYCWNIENMGKGQLSDRHLKSASDWAAPFFDEVLKDPLSRTVTPKYLEVSFSRACNFRCSYCSAICSSSWLQDITRQGPYPGREWETSLENLDEIYLEEGNPYIESFWKWWPELKKSLHTFRITGGEPLLSPNTFKVLRKLKEEPEPGLSLSINSNLGVPAQKVDQLIAEARDLLDQGKIKKLDLFTSLEAWEERAEFIRSGLDFALFRANLEKILKELPQVTVTLMVTFNALSVTSFLPMLKYILSLRKNFSTAGIRPCAVLIDISYLTHPQFQSIKILPEEYRAQVKELVDFMTENQAVKLQTEWGFYDWELAKITRLYEWMKMPTDPKWLTEEMANFYKYFNEYGNRRNLDFPEIFPEMESFWESCKELAEKSDRAALHQVSLATQADSFLWEK